MEQQHLVRLVKNIFNGDLVGMGLTQFVLIYLDMGITYKYLITKCYLK